MPATARARTIITDVSVRHSPSATTPSAPIPDSRTWRRIEKDLYLHSSVQRAWVYVALAYEEELAAEELVVSDIRVGETPSDSSGRPHWEVRSGGIWLLRENFSKVAVEAVVTEVDVLFGTDAVDPRPGWTLAKKPLQLTGQTKVPAPRLSALRGRARPMPGLRTALRVKDDDEFKILQVSDTHMVAGVGVCKDAMDATGKHLPESEADPLTRNFIGEVLDVEKPDLVVLTGDQIHHDVRDSQTALFKATAPMIERSIPFAAVFGNHDSEGKHALSRMAQMSILQNLPFSLCQPGPRDVEGIGNFYLKILAPSPSDITLATLYFLDSHGQTSRKIFGPDYDPIKQTQIDWFTRSCKVGRSLGDRDDGSRPSNISLVFQHIPLPEFRDRCLNIHSGTRGEPTEGPSKNSHFYEALVEEGVSAFGCGHDHVNDFCALLPRRELQYDDDVTAYGPWLCYGGASGFGGYCSYGGRRFHRRARVWQLGTTEGCLKTWTRVQYERERIDELLLIDKGKTNNVRGANHESRGCVLN